MQKFAVCPTCEGRGSHVNPAIDGHGISAEEMAELGPDFLEDYLRGTFDVACEECHGERVVPACRCGQPVAKGQYMVLDDEQPPYRTSGFQPYSACYDHLPPDEREWFDSEAETAAIYAAERRLLA